MSQPQSPSGPAAKAAPGRRFRYWPEALVILAAGLVFAGYMIYNHGDHHAGGTEKEAGSEELDLCRRFMTLKNTHDVAAYDLLGPAPQAPEGAISPEEAGHIDADTFLRGEFRVLDVRPSDGGQARRFVLVLKGSGVGPLLHVRAGDKVDRVQRVVVDPGVLVEVRDGRIYGVKTQLPPT